MIRRDDSWYMGICILCLTQGSMIDYECIFGAFLFHATSIRVWALRALPQILTNPRRIRDFGCKSLTSKVPIVAVSFVLIVTFPLQLCPASKASENDVKGVEANLV